VSRLDDEIQAHLDQLAAEYIRRGMSPEDARAAARRDFGGVARVRERSHELRPWRWFGGLRRDVVYAARGLRRTWGITAMAVLTLAVGIGANTAIFTAVNGVLLRPLPFAEPERLVMVIGHNTRENLDQYAISPANFLDLRNATRTLDRMEAMFSFLSTATIQFAEGTEKLTVATLAPGMFDLLGVAPELGRTLTSDDAAGSIVVSDRYWRARLGADRSAVGRELIVNGRSLRIVGVMPAAFRFPTRAMMGAAGSAAATEPDAWVPLDATAAGFAQNGVIPRSQHFLSVVGRLADGVTIDAAQQEIPRLFAALEAQFPDANRGLTARIAGLQDQAVAPIRPALLLLLAGVGLVLMMGCVNVANLMLARALASHREVAVQIALGAAYGRVLRQQVVAVGLVAAAGGVMGWLVSQAGLGLLARFAPAGLVRPDQLSPDVRVVLFLGVVSLACALAAALAPSLAVRGMNVQGVLRDGARGIAGGLFEQRLRGALVVAQVALAVVLTLGAGLLVRSFVRLLDVDRGFTSDGVLTLQVTLPRTLASPDARLAFSERLFDALETLPGVTAAGGTTRLPLGSTRITTVITPETADGERRQVEAGLRSVMRSYFDVMGIPIVRGRAFDASDRPGGPGTVILSEELAGRLWPGADPIGRRLRFGPNPNVPWSVVVGVVGDVRQTALDAEPTPELHLSAVQGPPASPFVVIRTSGDPAALAQPVRDLLRRLDPDLAVYDVRTMAAVEAQSMAFKRFILGSGLALGGLALLLSGIGIYGAMAVLVAERRAEIGVRLALGASPRQAVRLVLGSGCRLAGGGVLLGLAAGVILTPLMRSQLFGTTAHDAATLAAVPVVLFAAAAAACLVPAWRASQVDPLVAMRNE
jgi:predicted permease